MRQLLNKGAQTELKCYYGMTPLCLASLKGHEAAVRLLLEHGARVEPTRREKFTPLTLAIAGLSNWRFKYHYFQQSVTPANLDLSESSRTDFGEAADYNAIVQLFLDEGADVESKTDSGETPLFFAARLGREDTAALLLARVATCDSKNELGETPLLYAARDRQKKTVRLLLDKGAHVSSRDFLGKTPLLWATEREHKGVVKLLLRSGKLDAMDKTRAWELAAFRGYVKIEALLRRHRGASHIRDFFGLARLFSLDEVRNTGGETKGGSPETKGALTDMFCFGRIGGKHDVAVMLPAISSELGTSFSSSAC